MKAATLTLFLAAVAFSAAAQQHANQKKGFNAENVYALHDIDVINAFNGNLTVSIPIGPTYPIANGFSYGLVLHGNSNLWDSVDDDDDSDYNPSVTTPRGGPVSEIDLCDPLDGVPVAVPHRRANAGMGWILTMGRLFDWYDPTSGGAWVYESPDGADHQFHETLHEPPSGEPAGDDGYMYTRDGTYLRMHVIDATTREIEFPDGAVHKFKAPTGTFSAWMPIELRNRFTPNWLRIDYDQTPTISGGRDWVLTDNHGRTHKVIFESKTWNGGQRLMVKTVDLLAFGTDKDGNVTEKRALYQFNYTQRFISRTDWSERCSPWLGTLTVQTLDSIVFPDDPSSTTEGETKYQFGYKIATSPHDDNGLLLQAILPTGATIKWTWSLYHKPNESAQANEPYLQGSWGVEKRELFETASSQTPLATWTYVDTMDDNYLDEGNGDPDVYPREMTNTMTDPLGNVTVSYFSVSGTENPGIWDPHDYGRPFTRYFYQTQTPSSEKVWLSSVTYPAGVTINSANPLQNALKATYVRYEKDPSSGSLSERNWRVASSRVISPRPGAVLDFVDTDHTNFDGLGHFRTTKISGSFGSATKTTTTNYNPTMGPFPSATFAFPTSFNWVLNTYDIAETTQGTSTSRTDFCFDSASPTATGFLKRRRVQRGIEVDGVIEPRFDLLAAFEDTNGDGNVDVEKYAGGQANPLASGFITCTHSVAPRYTVNHGYSYGVRSSSQHSGANFRSLDLTIDPTGVPSASRDVSGTLTTHYVYNPMGQLRETRPQGEAWTEYLYNVDAGSEPHGSVTVKEKSPAGLVLTEGRYYYDSSGRLVQQRTSMGPMATSPWSASTMTYDLLGRRTAASVAMGVSSGSWASITPTANTQWQYDRLGRTTKIIQPDSSSTDIVYTGVSKVARTAKIATGTVQQDVTTTESFDALGRLASVTEDSTGMALETLYDYDEGDRLAKVNAGVQTRTFDYDGAGLLRLEDHPESDATTYEYDAGGHVTKRVTAGSTLRFVYDAAERLTTVLHDPDGSGPTAESTMKEFTFGAAGVGLGRPLTAKRHNAHSDLGGDATVTETFTYETTTGRVSSKATAVSVPGNPVRTFTDSYTYEELGATKTIEYPGCAGCGGGFVPPARTVANFYERGYLQSVGGYVSNFLYHANGIWAQFSRDNANGSTGPTDTQTLAANGMQRPESRSVSGHCTGFGITVHPVATKTVQQGADSDLSVTAPGATSFQWYGGETIIPNQVSATLHVPVNQTTSYWVRVGNGACTVDSSVSVVTVAVCSGAATISAPSSVKLGATGQTASVEESGTYAWTIQNGTITSATNTQAITFTAGCSGSVTLTVSFTPTCGGSAAPTSKTIPITVPSVTLSATPQSIPQGSFSTLTVAVSGTGPWSVKWADLPDPISVSGSANRSVTPTGTLLYEVQQVNGCTAATPPWASVTVTVLPPAPLTTTATKSSATSVLVAWTKPVGATIDSYRIERCTISCASGGNWTLAGTSAVMSFNDVGRPANTAYAYRVVSVRSGTLSTGASPPDFASTYAFTDDPVAIGETARAIYVSELRSAVSALRTAAGLGAYNYTDTMAAGLTMKALHLTQLQEALNEARPAFGAGPVTFTQSPPAIGGLIRATHINELRGGVQ